LFLRFIGSNWAVSVNSGVPLSEVVTRNFVGMKIYLV